MNNKLVIIYALLIIPFTNWSQSVDKKVAVGPYAGISDYHGDLNQEWFNKSTFRLQLGATIMMYVNPFITAGIDVGYGSHGFENATNAGIPYNASVLKSNFQGRLKFNNGKWLKEDSKFQPYIFGGIGIANTFENPEDICASVSGLDMTINSGLGLSYMISESIGINYNLNWAYTGADRRDNLSNGKNDQFMIHSVGLVIPLGKTFDTDEDGVSDRKDKCPNTPAGVSVDLFGCPNDNDGDGIADYQDPCPDVKGLPSMKGCPDSDGDGVTDAEDACPDLKGPKSANGCPDRDGDGIEDSKDDCPKVKGLAEFNGCPDTDGDGIKDSEDECPTLFGSMEFKGCPDSDLDGVPDNMDKCPTVAGVVSNEGCPEIKAETLKVFDQALKGIQFETSKAIIKPTSYGILDDVAKIMKENPTYNLDINGHTDAQGDDAKNMALSQERAASVRQYLIDKGISASRMESYGFGETQPKASNDTAAGRAENRRVEFKVRF